MPRKPRFNLVGIPQHVIQRGNKGTDQNGTKLSCVCMRQATGNTVLEQY